MNDDYERIERAIRYLQRRLGDQPGLEQVARHVGLSPYHFQRLFRRWVGISPKRYLAFLTVNHAKHLLKESNSVLDTAYALGLTAPSRLHEQFVSIDAATPGEFKNQWEGVEVRYGIAAGPFGQMLIAQTPRGVCMLSFLTSATKDREMARLRRIYGRALLREDDALAAETALAIFGAGRAQQPKFHLAVRGTNFQVRVWHALLKIPAGTVTSYRQLAQGLGMPRAARPVANAIAANPVNFLIPCHRVLRLDGAVGGFRGGTQRKQEILEWESSVFGQDLERPGVAADAAEGGSRVS
jgi:AraC family transcriptional regulator of adaptative response/methylated-DNA-[protein]-cysteine methyltransferase